LLPLAEFAYNSLIMETINVTLFFANYGYKLIAYKEPNLTIENNNATCI